MNEIQEKIRVLNVNDDAANRYAITRMLRLGQIDVIEAGTGLEALEKVQSERPDLVVLDVNLPDIGGLEVCARIKRNSSLTGISVLQLSATAIYVSDRVSGLESGADGYLTMPVEPAELLATVRALVRARRAEDASVRAAKRWRATFDAISEGVAVLGPDGELLEANAAMASLFPVPEETPLASMLASLSAGDLVTAAVPRQHELEFKGRWLRLVTDPIIENGAITGRVLTVTDLTERRRLETDLRQHVAMLGETDRRKDEFLAMLGHELRNPLGAISAALYNLNEPEAPMNPEWLRDVASRQVEQLSRLVDDLLDVSRITKGKIQLRAEPVDLRRTIGDVERAFHPMFEANRQTLEIVLPDEPLGVNGDPTRLEQIISNLVNNAAKYTPSGGWVRVVGEGTKDDVIVRVEDSGIGIGLELLPRIFDLFTQGEQTIDRPTGGLGIGLTVVRTLAQLHGGTIAASSKGSGQGSQFTFRIPRLFANVDSDGSGIWTRNLPQRGAAMEILVAEDNDDLRELMRVMLERRGHRVTAVPNGAAALDSVHASQPQVALIDLGLPEIDGYEVGRRVRAEFPDVRLIAISGYGRDEDVERSRQAGFEAHLVKPVRPSDLFAALDG